MNVVIRDSGFVVRERQAFRCLVIRRIPAARSSEGPGRIASWTRHGAAGAAFSESRIPNHQSRLQRGYTLIEVLVAFAVLALALTVLLGTLSGATRQVRWSADAGRAALHAQSLLAQVGVGEALQPGRRDGEFDDGRYRWTLDVAPFTDPLLPPPATTDPFTPQLMQLRLAVEWGDGGRGQRMQLDSLRLVQPDATEGALP
jgi:general secretion pathway protein I